MKIFNTTDKLSEVHSDIRGPIFAEAIRMQSEGINVLKLNTGNPAKFGFKLPESIREELKNNFEKAVPYCDLAGMPESRKAISDYHVSKGLKNVTPNDVYIGNGVSEVAQMSLISLLDNSDEILIPSPSYSLWTNAARIAGAKPVFYRCNEENSWQPDINDILKKITKKTKAIIIINPNNPTGTIYSDELLLKIGEIARERELCVISDEIYDRLIFSGEKHTSFASLCPDIPVITMNGLSKSHIICGFRCGWLTISDNSGALVNFREGITKLCSMRLCGNALTQLIIPAALKDSKYTQDMMKENGRLDLQRKAVFSVLDDTDGITYVKNRAAFYLFPKLDKEKFNITSDKKFALDLLHEKHILIIPGSGFDWGENDHFRIVMLPEPETMKKAMEDLRDFLSTYKQNKP